MKSYLIICKSAPYASMNVAESIELALGLASFEQKVALLFTEDGLLHLLDDQDASLLQQKTFSKAYKGLDLFGIEEVYVDAMAQQKFNIRLPANFRLIATEAIAETIAKYDYSICI